MYFNCFSERVSLHCYFAINFLNYLRNLRVNGKCCHFTEVIKCLHRYWILELGKGNLFCGSVHPVLITPACIRFSSHFQFLLLVSLPRRIKSASRYKPQWRVYFTLVSDVVHAGSNQPYPFPFCMYANPSCVTIAVIVCKVYRGSPHVRSDVIRCVREWRDTVVTCYVYIRLENLRNISKYAWMNALRF
jgi:hypothetical protein